MGLVCVTDMHLLCLATNALLHTIHTHNPKLLRLTLNTSVPQPKTVGYAARVPECRGVMEGFPGQAFEGPWVITTLSITIRLARFSSYANNVVWKLADSDFDVCHLWP